MMAATVRHHSPPSGGSSSKENETNNWLPPTKTRLMPPPPRSLTVTSSPIKEETLWSVFHKLKAVLEAPVTEKKQHQVTYDDSKRVVDMTEILPNLFIGDE